MATPLPDSIARVIAALRDVEVDDPDRGAARALADLDAEHGHGDETRNALRAALADSGTPHTVSHDLRTYLGMRA
ncbi:hypothetical protein [uncultured Pseudokineococcus sp.]|uniref:hypothetical protein n=1 Tax=uncultured Pseudokineococcus sp. TaxID=1642928 RepID=UPI0026209466|nr:hypothetical protein [uncultured Pseudokineococcus sp.]